MQRHKNRSALGVGNRRAIVKRGIFISLTRLYHLKSLGLQGSPHLRRKIQHNLAFANAARAPRTRVGPAVRRIEHDDVQPCMRRQWRRNLRGRLRCCGRLRSGGLRGRSGACHLRRRLSGNSQRGCCEAKKEKMRANSKNVPSPGARSRSTNISHVEQHTKSLPDSAPLESAPLRKRDGPGPSLYTSRLWLDLPDHPPVLRNRTSPSPNKPRSTLWRSLWRLLLLLFMVRRAQRTNIRLHLVALLRRQQLHHLRASAVPQFVNLRRFLIRA